MSEKRPPQDAEGAVHRATCLRCFRPERLCYCAHIQPISARTRVEIIQHPREIFHPLNTARLVERSLESASVLRGDVRSLRAQVRTLEPSPRRFLLFPSAESRAVEELDPSALPEHIVVLDGTWPMARALLREIPELQTLPHLRLAPSAPSRYRIRRPPSFESLSTLESIALLLSVLEPELDLRPLLDLFERMIDLNIEARVPAVAGPRFKRRAQRPHRFPELLMKSAHGAVLIDSEGLRPDGTARRIVAISVHAERESSELPVETIRLKAALESSGPGIFVTWQPNLRRALLAEGHSEVLLLRGVAADYLAHKERACAPLGASIAPRLPLGTLEQTLCRLGGIQQADDRPATRRLQDLEMLWRILLQESAET